MDGDRPNSAALQPDRTPQFTTPPFATPPFTTPPFTTRRLAVKWPWAIWLWAIWLSTAGLTSTAAAQSTPGIALTLAPPPQAAQGAPAAPSSHLDGFHREMQSLQRQIDELKASAMAAEPHTAAAPPAAPVVCCPAAAAKPDFPSVRVTGFFQADGVWFDQSLANKLGVGRGVVADGDAQDGADFRRARLAAVGQAWDNVSYMLEMDFAFPGHPSFMDVWLDIDQAIGANHLRVGQFRQPFGMDGQTSVKELTFLERSLPFAFLPFRQIGAMLYGSRDDELATWAVSGFRFPTDTYGGNVGDDGGWGMATRLTGLLVNNGPGNGLVHVGGGYSFVDPSNNLFQYRNQPEVFVGETGGGVPAGVPINVPPFVDTGLIAADNANLFNAELAMAYGSFYTQSEFFYAVVEQQGGPSLTLPGAYVQAGYFLTGEAREYNGKNGVFSRVNPIRSVGKEGGLGAWEIAGRWSFIDLNDNNIQGGRLNNLTAGLNWYLNPHTKFQWNYIHSMLDSPFNGDSDADIYAMRAQIDF